MALRIGVNALYLIPGGVGGTEIYLRSLLAGLAEIDGTNTYYVFTNEETDAGLLPARSTFHGEALGVRAAFRPGRILAEQTRLPFRTRELGLDVLLNPGFTAPLVCSCPCVTVFHDLQHKRHPEYFRRFDLPFWRMLLYGSARRAAHLIAVSEETKKDLLHFYRLDPRQITVVHHGVDPEFFAVGQQRRSSEAEPMLLCVSTLHPHKNLERLIRVFLRLRERLPDWRLVIAGLRGFHAEALEQQIQSLGAVEFVRLTGWIPRDELYDLFRRASAFVYPSTFEGFGMPVLEALAAGIPSACSSAEPMPSVGGDAAVYFNPLSDDEMLTALEAVADEPSVRARLVASGPARAAQFSWRKAAEQTLEVLEQTARQRK